MSIVSLRMYMDWANAFDLVKHIQSKKMGWVGQVGGYGFLK
jgi:hypothetical protein